MFGPWQSLSKKVRDVVVAGDMLDAELVALDTVLQPMKTHVDAFRHARDHGFVGESDSTVVVAIDKSGLLGVAKVVQDTAFRVGDAKSREETRVLCLLDCRADHRDEGGVARHRPVDEVQRVGV